MPQIRLRINPELRLSPDYEATLLWQLRSILRKGDARLIIQRILGERIPKIIGGGRTIFVTRPTETGADWDWDVGVMRWARRAEKRLGRSGVLVEGNTVILPSSHQSPVRSRQTVVVLRRDVYRDLPQGIKFDLNELWSKLQVDRTFEKIVTKRTGLFLFLCKDNGPTRHRIEDELSLMLEDWAAGYVSSDEFEINLLRRMLDTEGKNALLTPDG
jgi:hypothetical protein